MANSTTQPGSGVNKDKVFFNQSRHGYNLGYTHDTTERFGELNAIYAEDVIDKDYIECVPDIEDRNYTLASPLLTPVRKNVDFFFVPQSAILPRTWQYIQTQPVHGDDVVSSECNSLLAMSDVFSFVQKSGQFIQSGTFDNSSGSVQNSIRVTSFFRYILILNFFFGEDSLFQKLKLPFGFTISANSGNSRLTSWNSFFDAVRQNFSFKSTISSSIVSASYTEDTGLVSIPFSLAKVPSVSAWRNLCEFFCKYPDAQFSLGNVIEDNQALRELVSSFTFVFDNNGGSTQPARLLNISRIIAYKMSVAEFYTNSKIDDIYSKDLFISYIESIYRDVIATATEVPVSLYPQSFEYNGNAIFYDCFSRNSISAFFSILNNRLSDFFHAPYNLNTTISFPVFAYFVALFGPEYSLKFVDYFVGAKTQPVAVGDTTFAVTDGSANVLDMSRSVLVTRFLSFCNRVGQKWKDYRRAVFGGDTTDKPHDVVQISHLDYVLGRQEVENTAEDQGNITTLLRSKQNRFGFGRGFDLFGVVVGISWYDIERVYLDAITQHAFHVDRFDYFNPFLQNLQDQPLPRGARGSKYALDEAFGYQQPYMEYKQNFSNASGGFAVESTQLDSWAMIDKSDSYIQCSDFIRNHPSDFDRFYSSLTGIGAAYFHFICSYRFNVSASRNIKNNPPLLF